MEEFIKNKLADAKIQPRVLLARARLVEVKDWDSPSVNDPRNLPFYYYLGTQLKAEKVFEYGFDLGLSAACFSQGCINLKRYFGFQPNNNDFYYSFRLGAATLQEYFKGYYKLAAGGLTDFKRLIETEKWDAVLITSQIDLKFLHDHLEMIWSNTNPEALIVMDYLSNSEYRTAVEEWCSLKNRVPVMYETRYSVGIIVR